MNAPPDGDDGVPLAGIRVVIADDHPMFREGLVGILERRLGMEVVAAVGDGEAAVAAAVQHQPDLVIMDLGMPGAGGLPAIRRIVERCPRTRVVVLTMSVDDESVFAALRAGARGYLLKEADRPSIARALEAVVSGAVHLDGGVSDAMLGFFSAAPATSRALPFPSLTPREREILDLVARGLDNIAIAKTAYLSEKTVRNYVSNLFAKLGVADRAQAIVLARDAGLGA